MRLDLDRLGERLRTGLMRWTDRQSGQRGLYLGLAVCALLWLAIVVFSQPFGAYPYGSDQDARAYWLAWNSDPYAGATVGVPGAYLYSPAFLQLIGPLRAMSWPGFVAAWTLVLLVATAYLAGPELLGHRPPPGSLGDLGRQHLAAPGRGDRRRLPLAGGLGVRAADQGQPRGRPALVRRPARVEPPGRGTRGDGRLRRAFVHPGDPRVVGLDRRPRRQRVEHGDLGRDPDP